MLRDLKTFGLLGTMAALEAAPDLIAARALQGADLKNADALPFGKVVSDPVYRSIMEENGIDPDAASYPPMGAKPGEYTLNDLVVSQQQSSRAALAGWLPEGKGTDRGVIEVEMVNEFVEDFFPLVSEEGAEWEFKMDIANKVLHDLLNEEYPEIEDMDAAELEAFVLDLLEGAQE